MGCRLTDRAKEDPEVDTSSLCPGDCKTVCEKCQQTVTCPHWYPDEPEVNWRLELVKFAKAMESKLKEKDPQYGDSWKTIDVDELLDRLEGESQDLKGWFRRLNIPVVQSFDESKEEIMQELLDVANICMMLFIRLEKE